MTYEHDISLKRALEGKWSGAMPLPNVGAVLTSRMNNLGDFTVAGYFIEAGWTGVLAKFHNPPDWFVKKGHRVGHLFGAEIDAN